MSESRDYDLIRFPKDAWGKVPPFAYPTYVALLRYFGNKSECWPKISTLIEMTGMSARSVKRQLDALRESGLISSERGGSYGRNRYSLGGLSSATNGTCQPLSSAANDPCEVPPTAQHVVPPTAPPIEDYREKTTKKPSPPTPSSEDDGDDEVPSAAFDTEPPPPIIESLDKARDNRLEKARRWLALCAEAWPNVAMPTADNRQELHSIGEALDGWAIPDVSVDPFGHRLPPREVWLALLRIAGRDEVWRVKFNIRNPRTAARNAPKLIQRFVEHAQAEVRQQHLRALRAKPAEVPSA